MQGKVAIVTGGASGDRERGVPLSEATIQSIRDAGRLGIDASAPQ